MSSDEVYALARSVAAVDRIRWSDADQAAFDRMIKRVRARATEKTPENPRA
jgi:hypothetical protein